MSETDPVSLPLPQGDGRGEGQQLAQTAGFFAVTSLARKTAAAFVAIQVLASAASAAKVSTQVAIPQKRHI